MRKIEEIRQELKGKKLLVVPYMHADWAWCHTREWHARRYVAVFEDVIEVLKKNIGYKWYMDCFCTEMGPLLERRPELIAQLRPFVDSGDIQIAGGFSNVRPNMVGDEAYVRNMIIGRKRFEEHFPGAEMIVHGEGVDTALGHPQIPQLITKGGYRYLRAGRPYDVLEKKGLKREFIWEGLDGTRVLVWWGDYGGMFEASEVKLLQEKLSNWDAFVEYFYDVELQRYQRNTNVDVAWVAQGCDDVLPLKAFNADLDVPLPEIMEKWNQNETSQMKFAGPVEFFQELEKRGDRIQIHKGTVEIADVCYNVGWGGEKGLLNKRLKSSELLCDAETWQLLAQLQGADLHADFQHLWEESLTASAHATAWLFTEDYDALSARIEKAMLDANDIRKAALRALAERIQKCEGSIAMVFNGLDQPRDTVVSLTVPSGFTEGLYFVDGAGNTLPYQILKAYEYTDSVWEHEALVKVCIPAFGYTQVCVRGVETDCRLGGVFHRPTLPETVDASIPFVLDNGTVRLAFENGRIVGITDVETGKIHTTDANATAWNDLVFTHIDTDKGILHAGPILAEHTVRFNRATVLEQGPVRWRVRLEGSDGTVAYVQEIALEAGSRNIQIKVSFDWPESQGRLEARIPTPADCVLRGGIPFGSEVKDVDQEPYKDDTWDDMHRQWKGLFCSKDYVRAVSGETSTAIISVEADRFYIFDRQRRTLSYVLLNSARMFPNTWEDSVSRRSIVSAGRHEINYAVRIGKTGETDREVARQAHALRMPVEKTIPFARIEAATLPSHGSFMQPQPENIAITACYQEGNHTILRLYETDGNATETQISLPKNVLSAVSTNFIGQPDGRSIKIAENTITLHVQPHEIVTLQIQYS